MKNLKKVKKLFLSYNKLNSLNGIENLTRITCLDARGNRLTSIKQLKKLKKLRKLYIKENQLTDLKGIEKLVNLERLNASSNQLRNIQGIQKLKKLWYLNLGRNCLVSVSEISKLKKLHILELSFNKLASLPDFSKIRHLTGFGIIFNHLSLEEINRKTPKYLFSDREAYLKVMALVQNVDYTLQFTEPSDITQIHKSMKRIAGHAYMPNAVVRMIISRTRMDDEGECEVILWEVRVDENGDFVFDNLNFDQLEPGYDYFAAFDIGYDFYEYATDGKRYRDSSLRWYRIN